MKKDISKTIYELLDCSSSLPGSTQKVISISNQSEKVLEGTLFFALKGSKFDGHQFLEKVLKSGGMAVVEKGYDNFDLPGRVFKVEDTRKAWAIACSRWHDNPSCKMNLMGVTGTNGKTTSVYMYSSALELMGMPTGVVGTVQIKIGDRIVPSDLTTPDSFLLQKYFYQMVNEHIQEAALEVSSIALDQDRTWGTRFLLGIFTNLTQDHLDYHGSMESYYAAKKTFFEYYEVEHKVINQQDIWGRKLYEELKVSAKKNVCSFGYKDADFNISTIKQENLSTRFMLTFKNEKEEFVIPFVGVHNVFNATGVIAGLRLRDYSLKNLREVFSKVQGAPGRLELVKVEGTSMPCVFVDYAHTPDALLNVLSILKEWNAVRGGRIITVFGCGGDRDKTKRPLMGEIAVKWSDFVVVTSDNPRTEDPEIIIQDIETGMRGASTVHRVIDRRQAIHFALSEARNNDTVLIAGKGHENYQIIGSTKINFDDVHEVKKFYGDR